MLLTFLRCQRGAAAIDYILVTVAIGSVILGVASSDALKRAEAALWEKMFTSAQSKVAY